jgi:large subunit ribosomal protein L25
MSQASPSYQLQALSRTQTGTASSRRMRREERVPAIIYGGKDAPVMISLAHKDVKKALENKGVYSHVLTLQVDNIEQAVVLKDLQRHPYKALILHMDFLRVNATETLQLHVPLHFNNEAVCPGIKLGGVITHHAIEVAVRCYPKDLPEFLSLDLKDLDLNTVLHLSDIPLPSGVELVDLLHHNDHAIISIHRPRAALETDETADANASTTATAETDKKEKK